MIRGIIEAILSIVFGIILIMFVTSMVKDNLLPGYAIWISGLVDIGLSIFALIYLDVGILFPLGWLAGSFIMKDLLDPVGLILNIGAPIVIIAIRVVTWFKN